MDSCGGDARGVNANEEVKIMMAGNCFLNLAVNINWRKRVGKE